jgi:Right handed beta helix region/Bacterial Ig domain
MFVHLGVPTLQAQPTAPAMSHRHASPQAEEVFNLLQQLIRVLQPRSTPSVFYVAPGGNNGTSCDGARNPATPKQTINGASGGIACLASGDTLVLGDGLYPEQLGDYADDEHKGVTRPPSGSSWSAPTTIKAANAGKATLQLPDHANHIMSFGLADTRYISVEGLILDSRGYGACVWIGPASPIRMQGNTVRRCGKNGIYVDTTSGVELIGNTIEDVAMQEVQEPGTHAIYFVGSHGIIRGNTVRGGCPFFGIHLNSEYGGISSNLIEQNRVTGCHHAGILNQGNNTLIRNNLLHNNGVGLQCHGGQDKKWYGNTIIGYKIAPNNPDTYGILDLAGGCDYRNNLILGQRVTDWKSYIYSPGGQYGTLQGNLCDNPGEKCQHFVGHGTRVVTDAAKGDFTLVAGSAAIDKGVALPDTLPTDFTGRAQAPTWDVGAYAYGSAGPPPAGDTTPPTAVITSPSPGAQVSGTITLMATASDNQGTPELQFQVDGVNVGTVDVGPTYSRSWDSSTVTPGTHTVSAVARDQAGNVGQAPAVTITVGGSTPPPQTTLTCTGEIAAVPGPLVLSCQPGQRRY